MGPDTHGLVWVPAVVTSSNEWQRGKGAVWFLGPRWGRRGCLLPIRAQAHVGALATSCHTAALTPALNLAMQHADPWSKAG